jgi:hypothetical protein
LHPSNCFIFLLVAQFLFSLLGARIVAILPFLKPGRKLARKLDNGPFGGGAAEESIIIAFSVVVNVKALAFSFNSTVLVHVAGGEVPVRWRAERLCKANKGATRRSYGNEIQSTKYYITAGLLAGIAGDCKESSHKDAAQKEKRGL